jgi:phosphopantetheinyl transferase
MLWILEQIDQLNTDAVLSLLPRLSEARRARVRSVTHVPSKVRAILAELLLRHALRAEYCLTELPRIETGEKGKPFFPERPELHFNLSHCQTAVACALDASPLGVDVQELRPLRRAARPLAAASPSLPLEGKLPPVRTPVTDEVAPQARKTPPVYRILSDPERAWVEAGETPAEQDRRFTAVWTCKEAWGKALGVGILYDLKSTCFLPDKGTWKQYDTFFRHFSREKYELTLCSRDPLLCKSIRFEEIRDEAML